MFNTFVNTFPQTSTEILEKIEIYYSLLVKWNKSLNLVQKETLSREFFETRHLIDCWQLTQYLRKGQPILDIGSGAGLPGILLAIAGYNVDLIEQDMNKVSFLKNCKTLLNLKCNILPIDVYSLESTYEQITSRAFSQLNILLKIQSNVSRETKGFFLKGANYMKEIKEAEEKWNFNILIHDSISSPEGKILSISHLKEKCFT